GGREMHHGVFDAWGVFSGIDKCLRARDGGRGKAVPRVLQNSYFFAKTLTFGASPEKTVTTGLQEAFWEKIKKRT
ncbi:MAG: hypothetical protein J6A21_09585, partial [Lentisphaeria bacterium]|nr:hypothetical protein [Lentisphaeria bacterium]